MPFLHDYAIIHWNNRQRRINSQENDFAKFYSSSTCTANSGEHPTLSVADGATLRPLAQDVPGTDPLTGMNASSKVIPLSHQDPFVVITVDLRQRTRKWWMWL